MSELEKDAELKELPDTVEKELCLYEYETDSMSEQDGVVEVYSENDNKYIIDSKVGVYTVLQTYKSVDVNTTISLSKQLTLTYGVTTTELETITEDYELWLCSELESFFTGKETMITEENISIIGKYKFTLTLSGKLKAKFIEFMSEMSPHALEDVDTTTLFGQLPDETIVTIDYVNSTHPEFDP